MASGYHIAQHRSRLAGLQHNNFVVVYTPCNPVNLDLSDPVMAIQSCLPALWKEKPAVLVKEIDRKVLQDPSGSRGWAVLLVIVMSAIGGWNGSGEITLMIAPYESRGNPSHC